VQPGGLGGRGSSFSYTNQSYNGNGILNIANGSNFLNNISIEL
jgi:hypothetical protein